MGKKGPAKCILRSPATAPAQTGIKDWTLTLWAPGGQKGIKKQSEGLWQCGLPGIKCLKPTTVFISLGKLPRETLRLCHIMSSIRLSSVIREVPWYVKGRQMRTKSTAWRSYQQILVKLVRWFKQSRTSLSSRDFYAICGCDVNVALELSNCGWRLRWLNTSNSTNG